MLKKLNLKVNINGFGYLILSSLSILLIFNLFGCSTVPQRKTLAFFFDGVPDSTEKPSVKANESQKKIATPGKKEIAAKAEPDKYKYHKPYKDKQCGACHDQNTMGKFVAPQPAMCYKCHVDYSKKFKKVHGPVESGYCTACHEHHLSGNEKLLIRTKQELCLFCHVSGQVLKNKAHKDIADANCTNCHNPHGGNDRKMLK
ncbi:MAG: hypothetical protein NT004_02680 [Bacteroidetes bacterium]|nr:hypothetical protein [Bacteroidota bacterium]